jgi:hypothetical protein
MLFSNLLKIPVSPRHLFLSIRFFICYQLYVICMLSIVCHRSRVINCVQLIVKPVFRIIFKQKLQYLCHRADEG